MQYAFYRSPLVHALKKIKRIHSLVIKIAMKKTITILFLLISTATFSQTKYYTTDGENRLTKSEIEKILSEQIKKAEKVLKKKLYGSLVIEETETKNDSTISKVTFAISDKKKENLINSGPLSKYKDKGFPKFNLKTLKGESFNFEQLKGKPTLINFWFTKCAPCIDEMPFLNEIAEKYKDSFNFISITYEKEEDVSVFLKKHPYNFKHLVDAKEFIDQLGITAYPLNVFLDKNGVLKYVKGGVPYISEEGKELKIGEGSEIIKIIEELK